jgi:hypothetical protein
MSPLKIIHIEKEKKSDLKGKEFIWVMLSLHQELMLGFTCENAVAGNISMWEVLLINLTDFSVMFTVSQITRLKRHKQCINELKNIKTPIYADDSHFIILLIF